MNASFADGCKLKLMVVSHERSGTHFLMNSLAKAFGYVSTPWVNFDNGTIPINFYASTEITQFFGRFQNRFPLNIFKSHHSLHFLEHSLESFIDEFHIFYIYRDPRDVMISYWRFLNQLPWNEGPKPATPKQFIRAEPQGYMMRYQWKQQPSVIHRWRSHVDSWMLGLPDQFRDRVTFIRFADLQKNYESTIASLAPVLGKPQSFEKPSLKDSTVLPHSGNVGGYKEMFDADDLALFRQIAGPTMERLGYI